jgi:hypothetical protein
MEKTSGMVDNFLSLESIHAPSMVMVAQRISSSLNIRCFMVHLEKFGVHFSNCRSIEMLSPKCISSVATVSFSFIIGTTFMSSKAFIVLVTLDKLIGLSAFSCVIKTCAVFIFFILNICLYNSHIVS